MEVEEAGLEVEEELELRCRDYRTLPVRAGQGQAREESVPPLVASPSIDEARVDASGDGTGEVKRRLAILVRRMSKVDSRMTGPLLWATIGCSSVFPQLLNVYKSKVRSECGVQIESA